MLRDIFNFTILEMAKNKDRVRPSLIVFGSRTFKETTKLIAMDYNGMYCTGQWCDLADHDLLQEGSAWQWLLGWSVSVRAESRSDASSSPCRLPD